MKKIDRIARTIARKFDWDCTLALLFTEHCLNVPAFQLNNLVYDRSYDIDMKKPKYIHPVFNHIIEEYKINSDNWTNQKIYDLVIAVNSDCNMHSFNSVLEDIFMGEETFSISGKNINLEKEFAAQFGFEFFPESKQT